MPPRMGEFTEEWVRQKVHRLYVEAEAQMDVEPLSHEEVADGVRTAHPALRGPAAGG
jgi:hypothetical protein